MITAVDTSVLLDVLSASGPSALGSRGALTLALTQGDVIAGDVVWAETTGWFTSEREMRETMDRLGVRYVAPSAESTMLAGQLWRTYRAEGGSRTRLVPDFLVGAHATVHAERLLTRDRGFFRRYFRELPVLDPSAGGPR